jgi:hypothetical protein
MAATAQQAEMTTKISTPEKFAFGIASNIPVSSSHIQIN